MSAKDIVKSMIGAVEASDSRKIEAILANNLAFSGPVPQPMGKREFVDLMQKVQAGVPNWKFNATNLEEHGDRVRVTVQVTGKQTRTLPGLFPGMADLPATNRSFNLPQEHIEFMVKDDKITKIQVEAVPGGGILGMLAQLGAKVPTH